MTVPTKKTSTKPQRRFVYLGLVALLLAAGAAGLWYVKVADPNGRSILPPCLLHEFTGLYCTGCGMTRALHYIMNGQLYQGFRMNPLAVLSLPVLIWVALLILYRLVMDKPLPSMPSWLPWAILAVIVLYTVARNLPWEPFSWLAPTVLSWVRQ
jgi:hypothetical protein